MSKQKEQTNNKKHAKTYIYIIQPTLYIISQSFQDTMRYCLEIANFWYPTSILIGAPVVYLDRRNFTVGSSVVN